MNPPNLSLFIPTFLVVSLTPGMCMTLSLSLGMTIGIRRTFWMMSGELLGVGLVAGGSVVGAAAIMLGFPQLFMAMKILGGAYLCWLGVELWRSRGKLAVHLEEPPAFENSPWQLATQGFVTAVANPKGWAFFIALLPPFINRQLPVAPQLALLLGIILTIEFLSLVLYATGGRTLGRSLLKSGNVRLVNRIAGTLMGSVGIWLALA